jgi:N-acetylneuraminic acid mutarotase
MKKLYITICLSFICVLAIAQGTWHVQAQFSGAARYRACSFVVNGKCYLGTGSMGNVQNLQDFWEYDPATNAWTQKADLTGPKRTNATGASDDTYGYVGLGSNNGVVLTDWWQFDPVANTWTQKTSFPSTSRYGAGSFTLQNMIYVGGGIDSANSVHGDLWQYDPSNDTWAQKHIMPTPVTAMATYVINGKGYFVGGAINGGVTGSMQNAEYDPLSDSWTLRDPFPGGNIYSCVGFVIDGYGYVGTGFCGNLTTIMYRYDPVANNWVQETDFPNGIRQWAVVCNVNNRAYVGTGNSTGGNLYSDWWEFVPVITGIKNQSSFPQISFDATSHNILVKNATGSEQVEVFTIDGKLLLHSTLQKGTNYLATGRSGILFVRVKSGGQENTTKIFGAE